MLTDYPGPRGRMLIDAALKLGPRYALMPKSDGACARIRLDSRGRIASVLSRAGRPLEDAADLIGIQAGAPDSVLWAELEAHTESGRRHAETRGYALAHLWDVTRYAGRDVTALPFGERYGLLHRGQAELECEGRGRDTWWTEDDAGNAHDQRGRFARPIPRDLRRLPILPLARGRSAASDLWRSFVEVGGGEGAVAVALDAPVGRRRAKVKVKATDQIDCRVLEIAGGVARLSWRGGSFLCSARGRWSALRPGAVVAVAHDGFYEARAEPRFARIVSERADLA
jgi:hypothetical protein